MRIDWDMYMDIYIFSLLRNFFKYQNAGHYCKQSVWYRTVKKLTRYLSSTGMMHRSMAFFGPVLEFDYGCRNLDAGFSFLDANAQLGCYCGLLCLGASEGSCWL